MKKFSFFIALFFVTALFMLQEQAQAQKTVVTQQPDYTNMSTPLPIDPKVKIGVLDNGLKYYIKHNTKPEGRVSMRLVVNAGSINETDAQSGLAHFTEHMLFNGTKNFPKNELINFLQKTGMKFGADINAGTIFDETYYDLELATDDKNIVKQGMLVLEDWAHAATLNDQDIEEERGVIIEEWRLGLGAQDRMRKKYLPILFNGSLHADRIPIGRDDEQLRTFKPEELKKFYHDFYRPNLQAVIVVGDIDVNEMEAMIKAQFSTLKNPAKPVERKSYAVPDNDKTLIAIVTDKEATSNVVSLIFKYKPQPAVTVGDYRRDLALQLSSQILNNRLEELGQDPKAPFVYASQWNGNFVRTLDINQLAGVAKENQIDATLKVLLTEAARVDKYGFLQSELDRTKESFLRSYESMAKEADKTNSGLYTKEYMDNFLRGVSIPGIEFEYALAQKLLPMITLEEVTKAAQDHITDNNRVVIVEAPDKEGVIVPTEAEIAKILEDAKNISVEPYVDNFVAEALVELPVKPASGAKVALTNQLQFIYEITLSNGIKVVAKPTKLKNDQILFGAYSLGGTSTADLANLMSAKQASEIQSMSGVGKFDNIELTKQLQGKNVGINVSIEDLRTNINGSASPEDFETLLQLNYLNFTAPRKDKQAFESYMSKMTNQLKFLFANPTYAYYDKLFKTAKNNDPRFVFIPSVEQMQTVNEDVAFDFYKKQLSNAGNYNFYMVGNFNVDNNLLSLLETYIGSLPVNPRDANWRDVSFPAPSKTIDEKFAMGAEEQSTVGIVFDIAGFDWDNDRIALSFFKEIMAIKLVETIREKLGGVYSPMSQIEFEKYPKCRGNYAIMFGCDPNRADELTKAVFDEMNSIIKNGPTAEDLDKVQKLHIRNFETSEQENSFWLSALQNVDYSGYNINEATVQAQTKRAMSVTADVLKATVAKYIDMNKYVRMVLVPEASAAKPATTPATEKK
jgi:zinc protease